MSFEREKELLALFEEAEFCMKKIEVYAGEYFTPASNELRYAFGHYLKYKTNGDESDYFKSKNHILRATYDAKEVILIVYLDEIKDFEKKYKSVSIDGVIKDWIEKRKTLNEVKALLTCNNDLKGNYSKFDKVRDDLEEIIKTIEAAEPELEKCRKAGLLQNPILIAIVSAAIGAVITALINSFI